MLAVDAHPTPFVIAILVQAPLQFIDPLIISTLAGMAMAVASCGKDDTKRRQMGCAEVQSNNSAMP